jgi:hypothetical protein
MAASEINYPAGSHRTDVIRDDLRSSEAIRNKIQSWPQLSGDVKIPDREVRMDSEMISTSFNPIIRAALRAHAAAPDWNTNGELISYAGTGAAAAPVLNLGTQVRDTRYVMTVFNGTAQIITFNAENIAVGASSTQVIVIDAGFASTFTFATPGNIAIGDFITVKAEIFVQSQLDSGDRLSDYLGAGASVAKVFRKHFGSILNTLYDYERYRTRMGATPFIDQTNVIPGSGNDNITDFAIFVPSAIEASLWTSDFWFGNSTLATNGAAARLWFDSFMRHCDKLRALILLDVNYWNQYAVVA